MTLTPPSSSCLAIGAASPCGVQRKATSTPLRSVWLQKARSLRSRGRCSCTDWPAKVSELMAASFTEGCLSSSSASSAPV